MKDKYEFNAKEVETIHHALVIAFSAHQKERNRLKNPSKRTQYLGDKMEVILNLKRRIEILSTEK